VEKLIFLYIGEFNSIVTPLRSVFDVEWASIGGVGVAHMFIKYQNIEASNLISVWVAHKILGRCENDPVSQWC